MRVALAYAPAAFGCLFALAILALAGVRNLEHRNRERGLEDAVVQRTRELEFEHARQAVRNTILETLVTHQPLGVVLDGIAQSIRDETAGSSCAIVLNQASRSYLAATAGVSADWAAALGAPHAIPFETRTQTCFFEAPELDPAWTAFLSGIRSKPPARIYSCPIGSPDLRLGSICVFAPAGSAESPIVSEQAVQLAQIAIEHSRLYEDLQFQAHHDGLTGLPNRMLFEERLTRAVLEARTLQQRLAVLYVDLDRFKQINDSMSHRIGDLLLREIASRMKKVLRPDDTIARIGGDEFNILLPNIQSNPDAEALAERILNSVRQPMSVEGRVLNISASMGIAYFPDDGQSADDLQRDADAAMYSAKGSGRDRAQVFSARNVLDRIRLERELRSALQENRFEVHYQPKVRSDGQFVGMEALLRLTLPAFGAVPPARFVPIAEESGLIVPLGLWVLAEVCRQISEWKAQGYGEVPVAVNVSPVQIRCVDFADRVEETLVRSNISPRLLELELTETLLIGSGDETQRQMQRLRALGVTFSIDDFGTGYSSLSYLHRLKVDAIKLDRAFVQSIDTDDAARRLVHAMIGVAEGLGLNVIAEGVETEAQRLALVAAGCPVMQGFLFATPRAAVEMSSWLAGRSDSIASVPASLSLIDDAGRRAEQAERALQPV
ncbi:MAG TPA: EAL domain-containing protein [Bryobacteraceae bacterium]|nr:EAL domain-containing protein [Bryobacteraceae bacterium]